MNKMLPTAFLAVFGLGVMSPNTVFGQTICNTPIKESTFYINKKTIAGNPAGTLCLKFNKQICYGGDSLFYGASVYVREERERCSDVRKLSFLYVKMGDGIELREAQEREGDDHVWYRNKENKYRRFLCGTNPVPSCELIRDTWNAKAIRFFNRYKEDDGTPYTPVQTTGAQGDLPSGCAAFAKGDDGKTYKGASRDSKENAEKLALFECMSATNNCKVEFSICN